MRISWPKADKYFFCLALILVIATILRFYGLTNQSLWFDELHTMNEADPTISWGKFFEYLRCCELFPPLFFVFERFAFYFFGDSEFVAKSFTALCGVLSVWAMYLLGKEILNKELGLIAALLTAVNYFNIAYSQEARPYSLYFLIAVLSNLQFIILVKKLSWRHAFLYALSALALLYTNYFAAFIVASHGLVAFILFLGETDNRKHFLKLFSVVGLIIVVGYLPWIPFLQVATGITSFWIAPIKQTFAVEYFEDYFGNSALLMPVLTLLLLYYAWNLLSQKELSLRNLKESPLTLSFLILFAGITVSYLIPYLRSAIVVPMLLNRYTIAVLPGFLLFLAFAIVLINNRIVQWTVITIVVGLSLTDIVVTKRHYSKYAIRKTQFREMTEFIATNSPGLYPIVEEKSSWQHGYYLRKFNYNARLIPGNKEATVEAIIRGESPEYRLNRFWLVGAHVEAHLDPAVRARLDIGYRLAKEREFVDTWAQLFVKKDSSGLDSFTDPKLFTEVLDPGTIMFGVDKFDDFPDVMKIEGWAALPDQDVNGNQVSILLKAADGTVFISPTNGTVRHDVTVYFEKKNNFDDSGFFAIVYKAILPKGKYQVGISILDPKQNRRVSHFIETYFEK